MTPELTSLLWSTALLFVQIIVSAAGNVRVMGNPWAFSNRDQLAKQDGFPGRAKRAYMNMLENFVVFAALVFVAQLAGVHSGTTVLGAEIFLVARIVYAIVYLAGFTALPIRTLAWLAGVAGSVMIFWALVTA